MSLYGRVFDAVLTRVDAERAHHAGFAAIRAGAPLTARLPRGGTAYAAMGLRFPNRLGLAAGFDKNAVGIDALGSLGFGFVEVGTVTGHAQPGNPRPRLFRLPEDRAIVNRMGFNNDGAEAVAARLAERGRVEGGPVLGINIGKTKVVPEDDEAAVVADHRLSARLLAPYADYLVVNVSSPNTPGLRTLQAADRLRPILAAVRDEAERAAGRTVPLLVKIAPDLDDAGVLAVADLAMAEGLAGVVATNTTIAREGLRSDADAVAATGAGGLSGAPLTERATAVVRLLRDHVGTRLTLIGVGGIDTPEDALARIEAGADLVQAYTGFVYGGPRWPAQVVAGLDRAPVGRPR